MAGGFLKSKLLVARGIDRRPLVLFAGPELQQGIDGAKLDTDELLNRVRIPYLDIGLSVLECTCSPETADDFAGVREVDEVRAPTEEEWQAVIDGRNPWR